MIKLRLSFRSRIFVGSILIFVGLYLINFHQEYLLIGSLVVGISTLIILFSGVKMRHDINKLEKKTERIAKGDLIKSNRQNYKNTEIGDFEYNFDKTLDQVKILLSTVYETSDELENIAEKLVEETSDASNSVQDFSSKVDLISASSNQQHMMVNKMKNNLQEHLKNITEASSEISEASYFVGKVAQRTNILGLNASIEASKAGSYGDGFNIVAQEIRELSLDTKSNANRISETIEVLNYNIKQTVETMIEDANLLANVTEDTASHSELILEETSTKVLPMMSKINHITSQLIQISDDLNEIMENLNL